MKKLAFVLAVCATLFATASCINKEKQPVKVQVQLTLDAANLAEEGVTVRFADVAGTATYEELTNAAGVAEFKVPAGLYNAVASFRKPAADGSLEVLSGSVEVQVAVATPASVVLPVVRVKASQIIIKEVYVGGAPKDATSAYLNDSYITLYNNTDKEVDLTDIVIGLIDPSTAQGTNKYLVDGKLSFDGLGYIPAYSAIWSFAAGAKVAPYSDVTIALFGAIDHTATYPNAVDLSNPAYYWMSKNTQFTNAKYQVSDAIAADHYLSCTPCNLGSAWVIANMSPGVFVGKMSAAEVKALVDNKEAYDQVGSKCPKFPVANVLDVMEGWDATQIEKSNGRFPASLNVGYVAVTNKQGHSFYRNVDADATKALPENAGKLVFDYKGCFEEPTEAQNDPSGIDAEASIAAGAHIIYSDTNNSGIDFHERGKAAIKK